MSDVFDTISACGNDASSCSSLFISIRNRVALNFLMKGFNDSVSFLLPRPQVYPVRITPRSWISCQVLKDERYNRMASTSEMRRYLIEYLTGRQSLICEQVVFAIRSSAEISSSERLTDQQLIDHFPQLFADLVEYFLTELIPLHEDGQSRRP